MDVLNIICISIAVAEVTSAVIIVVIYRYNSKQMMKILYKMLEDAISREFK